MYRVALGQPALPAARSAARETPLPRARSRLHDRAGARPDRVPACSTPTAPCSMSASPVAAEAAALGSRAGELSALWRRKQLEYTWLRSLMRRHADFCRSHRRRPRPCAGGLGHRRSCRCARGCWRPIAISAPIRDVGPALRRLREQGMRTAILSNGTPAMLADGVAAAGIADLLDRGPLRRRGRHVQAGPRGLSARDVTARRCRPPRSPSSRPMAGTCTGRRRSASAAIWVNRGRLADDRLPGAAVAGDRRSGGPARRCSGRGAVAAPPMTAELPVRFADVARRRRSAARSRRRDAAAGERGAERAGRRPAADQARAAAAHRLLQVPRRLQRDLDLRPAGRGRLLLRQPCPGRGHGGAGCWACRPPS